MEVIVGEIDQYTRKRGIYLLPNILTTTALFAGFYAIIAAQKNDFEVAAIAIFIAMIMDSLDGRVARLTNTATAFGAQYDSLSDMVCFGITPALVVYSWGLQYLGKLGWVCAFLYVAATALRLSRFNVQEDKTFFVGMPCTSAAGVVAGMVWLGTDFAIHGKVISEIVGAVVVMIALFMVSNMKYSSFKEIDFKNNVPFVTILAVVLLFAIIAWDPPKMLFSLFLMYAMSGPALFLRQRYMVNKTRKPIY